MSRDWLQFAYPPTVISEGTRMNGDLSFVSSAQIHGIVEGNVHQSSLETLQVGATGWIAGTIDSKGPVLVEGRVDGDISSETSIRLHPTASVSGALKAPVVQVLPGALFQGDMQMQSPKVRNLTPRRSVG